MLESNQLDPVRCASACDPSTVYQGVEPHRNRTLYELKMEVPLGLEPRKLHYK